MLGPWPSPLRNGGIMATDLLGSIRAQVLARRIPL
jgi:hypothetical protein